MNALTNLLGKLCETLLPIPENIYFGDPKSSLTICTLSSMDLMKQISESDLMKKINVVGRLLSENKGIDSLIRHVISNKNIITLLICGKEVSGHNAGQSLVALHKNGVDENNRIISATSPDPLLTITKAEVEKFRSQVKIVEKIGEINFTTIKQIINSLLG